MALPNVAINFTNGGLGIAPAGAKGIFAKIGVSCGGTAATAYPLSTPSAALSLLKGGPLMESVYQHIATTGKAVIAVPVEASVAGSISATFTLTGTGTGDVTATLGPHVQILVKCSTAGALGTARFQFSVDGAAYGSPVSTTATSTWVYRVPGTFCTLTFAAGTYVLNSVYTIATTGVVTYTEGALNAVTQASSPLDSYAVRVKMVKAGARGTAQFTYSLDGGGVVSSPVVTAATYVVPNTGIVLGFSDETYVLDDIYDGTAVAPSFAYGDIGTAVDAALASVNQWEGIHVVGGCANAAGAVSMTTTLYAKLLTAATSLYRYVFGIVECPTVEADATITAAFLAVATPVGRVQVTIGNDYLISQRNALTLPRNKGWDYCMRLASSMYSDHPGEVAAGARPSISSIAASYSGVATADAFDAARFVTSRTIVGRAGYYITRGNTMDEPTSDYSYVQNVRVINAAATIAQAAFTEYLNGKWRIDATTGHLDARDAAEVEGKVETMLRAQLCGARGTSTYECSAIKGVTIDPESNLLTNKTLNANVQIVPFGYSEFINVSIGMVNPLIG